MSKNSRVTSTHGVQFSDTQVRMESPTTILVFKFAWFRAFISSCVWTSVVSVSEARAAVAIGLALRVAADEHMNGSAPKPQTCGPEEGLYGGDGFNVESMRAAADRIRRTIVATKEA